MTCKFSEIVKLAGNHKQSFIDIDGGKWYFNLMLQTYYK